MLSSLMLGICYTKKSNQANIVADYYSALACENIVRHRHVHLTACSNAQTDALQRLIHGILLISLLVESVVVNEIQRSTIVLQEGN